MTDTPDKPLLHYRVEPFRPHAHCFDVRLAIPDSGSETLTLSFPAWIPGSYMIRDFARNVVHLSAATAAGPVTVEKLDKQTWRLSGVQGSVELRCEVYAWDLSVRGAHLDQTHAYFNGASLFPKVHELEQHPCRVELRPPPGAAYAQWQVATSLKRAGAEPWGFGQYIAEDYEDLIDHPVEMGVFDRIAFKVNGVPHWMVFSGRHRADLARLTLDLPRICEEHAALFGELPVDRYLFLTQLVGDGYGGLEHRYSSSLMASRNDLPAPLPPADGAPANAATASTASAAVTAPALAPPGKPSEGYQRFLGLCSHEYFHLWNVKRIRPQAFIEQGLEREVHTRLLWWFEGITSYYDDLALVRSGVIDAGAYLTLLAGVISRVLRNPGRLRQSTAESSFDAWTRFYKQDENAPNAIVSYYAKGALTALALDLTLRERTGGACRLDDLMRVLWRDFGRTGVGVGEREIEQLASELAGTDLTAFFDHALDSTQDLELPRLLATVGVAMRLRPARNPEDTGGCVGRFEPIDERPELGARLQPNGNEARLAVVLDGRPAQQAGLAPGDLIVAVDGLRATAANLDALLTRASAAGAVPVSVHAFRRDELMRFEVVPQPAPADTCELCLDDEAPAAVLAARRDWLASVIA
ncbi:MAG: PDZ domain-containing protein [Gammaproteobacteria bacterium]|jgi:predicted metalloprotease with PDZ domain|nr:PDZ domain-containing protein [Gammaproteobacteria bacterium]